VNAIALDADEGGGGGIVKEGRKAGRKEGRKDGRTDGWKEGRTDGRTDGRTAGRKDGRTKGRKEGDALQRVNAIAVLMSAKGRKEGKKKEGEGGRKGRRKE
jgi:hypothetical protein